MAKRRECGGMQVESLNGTGSGTANMAIAALRKDGTTEDVSKSEMEAKRALIFSTGAEKRAKNPRGGCEAEAAWTSARRRKARRMLWPMSFNANRFC